MRKDRDPTLAILSEAAKAQVAEDGQFLKSDVINSAGFGAYEDKISGLVDWNYVRGNVEAESGHMVPLSEPDNGRDPSIHPEAFLPGRGRPTAGYALATTYPRVAMAYAERRFNAARGAFESVDRMMASLQAQGLSIGYKPVKLPVLSLPSVAAE